MTENTSLHVVNTDIGDDKTQFKPLDLTDTEREFLLDCVGGRQGNFLLVNFDTLETVKEARLQAGQFHAYINKGKKAEENLEAAQAAHDKIMNSIGTMTSAELVDLSPNLAKLLKVIASDGKIGFSIGDDGKVTLKGSSGKSGNGDRTNPLSPFESTNAIMRGKNGDRVLALRGDAIPDYKERGLSDSWQAFQIRETGEHKGYWVWKGALGTHECTSWTGLNNTISKEILGKAGSDGVNGLEEINPENLETIRTTQLRGL